MKNRQKGMSNYISDQILRQMYKDMENCYKTCYDIGEASFDIMREALEEYINSQPKLTYEQEMAGKLSRVRSQIEYDETWFTPTLEDLKDGDEVELMSSYGWFKGTWPGILWQETHLNLWGGNTIDQRFKHASLRKRKDGKRTLSTYNLAAVETYNYLVDIGHNQGIGVWAQLNNQ